MRPHLSIETPVHRYSANARSSGRSIHLFDDLVATENATFCDYETRFSDIQIAAALELLASLHGHFYDDPPLKEELSWIPNYEVFFDALAATGTRKCHDQALVEARDVIPARIFAAREKLWPAAVAGLAVHSEQPRTVLHSDLHPGNWYLTGAGAPGLCDWQCIVQGHWARDFAYAVSTMLDVEQRRASESELLRHYLQCLAQANGPEINFDDAFEDYARQLPSALLMWTPTLCHPPTMPDMQPKQVSIEMIRRIAVAIDDLGVLRI